MTPEEIYALAAEISLEKEVELEIDQLFPLLEFLWERGYLQKLR